MPPLRSIRSPACLGLPSRAERVDPGGSGYLVHRLRPSLRRAVWRGGGAGALRGCGAARVPRRRRRVQALPASRSGPGWPRLLKAPASAPAPPLAGSRDAPQSGAVGPRPEATGSRRTQEAGKGRESGFFMGMGIRFGVSPSRGGFWEEEARGHRESGSCGGCGARSPGGGRRAEAPPGAPLQVIFLRSGGGRGAGRAKGRGRGGAWRAGAGPYALATAGGGPLSPAAQRDPAAAAKRR